MKKLFSFTLVLLISGLFSMLCMAQDSSAANSQYSSGIYLDVEYDSETSNTRKPDTDIGQSANDNSFYYVDHKHTKGDNYQQDN